MKKTSVPMTACADPAGSADAASQLILSATRIM
jgi:hypothetical protein